MRLNRLLGVAVAMGILSLIAFVLERLALTDIFHGEPDLSLEWGVVSATFLPLLLFHILAIAGLALALRALRSQN